ncbi:hypothetical protein [Nocardioides sp. ChNu-99]|uniref:hypothetical protein n=1 Tax=Nocardioides sp. ChNu-99 TaxID=2839897 RepID=UPI002404B677|nr:hypothetical protein [Nocardioides sp. ChNu-99]MDF9717877.1 hypothetical protein [Nocardioides sp. ChNu-99]
MTVTVTVAHGPERDPARDYEAERYAGTGETYEAARDAARAQVPAGHVIYSFTRD